MRRAIAADFAASARTTRVIVTLDPREPEDHGPWSVVRIGPDEWPGRLLDEARRADYTVVIAPETRGVLADLARGLASTGARSLGCHLNAIELASDKFLLADRLRGRGVPIPEGRIVDLAHGLPPEVSFPAVFKPIDGAGSVDTFLLETPEDLPEAARMMGPGLLQPFHEGVPMSGSFLVDAQGRPWLIGIGRQSIAIEQGRFAYRGGVLPVALPGG